MDKKTALLFFADLAALMRKRKYKVWVMEASDDRIRFFGHDGKSLCSCATLASDGEVMDPAFKEF